MQCLLKIRSQRRPIKYCSFIGEVVDGQRTRINQPNIYQPWTYLNYFSCDLVKNINHSSYRYGCMNFKVSFLVSRFMPM